MKKNILNAFLFIALSLTTYSLGAIVVFDLTEKENQDLAVVYPDYQGLTLLDFNDTENNTSIFSLQKNNDSNFFDVVYVVKIDLSKGGKQKLYFYAPIPCVDEEGVKTLAFNVNDQNVNFNQYCSQNEMYFSAKSEAGSKYIIEQFRTSEFVSIVFNDLKVIFDAKGFIKAWDNYGGDAL